MTYLWELLETPFGSNAQLSDNTAINPYFIPDLPGDYRVQLVVCDGELSSAPAMTTITASEPGEGVDLSLMITDDPDPVLRKQNLTYTLTISNQSPDPAIDVRLVADLVGDVRGTPVVDPAELCSYTAEDQLTCSLLDSLEGNSSIQVLLSVVPKRPGLFAVEATVSAGGEDPDPADNTFREETTVLK